ncbi:hypothetical protein BGX23_000356 [Mortierella sp. AD031]|nr:hypothetical protein BGX23_000356 [Mortierella sp. AD031]
MATGSGDTETEELRAIRATRLAERQSLKPRAPTTWRYLIPDQVDSEEDTDYDEATAPAGTNERPKKKKKVAGPLEKVEDILGSIKEQDIQQNSNFATIMVDSQKDHLAALAVQNQAMRLRMERDEKASTKGLRGSSKRHARDSV